MFECSFQDGEFLVLPFSVNIDGVKVLIDGALGISQSNKSNNAIRSNPSQGSSESGSTVLKLSSQKGKPYICTKAWKIVCTFSGCVGIIMNLDNVFGTVNR